MTIREAIATVFVVYGPGKSHTFADHTIARVARRDFPKRCERLYRKSATSSREAPVKVSGPKFHGLPLADYQHGGVSSLTAFSYLLLPLPSFFTAFPDHEKNSEPGFQYGYHAHLRPASTAQGILTLSLSA
jgi:hypothetical protein